MCTWAMHLEIGIMLLCTERSWISASVIIFASFASSFCLTPPKAFFKSIQGLWWFTIRIWLTSAETAASSWIMNRDDITGGGGGREGGGCTVFCTVNTRDNLLLLTMSARFYFLAHRKKTKCQFCVSRNDRLALVVTAFTDTFLHQRML